MNQLINDKDKKWLDDTWEKITNKLSAVTDRVGNKIPYTSIDGKFIEVGDMVMKEGELASRPKGDINWWTNGFWPGLMMLMYDGTGNSKYLETARRNMDRMDEALANPLKLHHDVGFMWNISSGADYRLTGDEKQHNRLIQATAFMMNRYNLNGKFLRAWNSKNWRGHDTIGFSIIDCMMNIPMLYRLSEETGDERFKMIAMSHADTTMQDHVRSDGSVNHVVEHDPVNGGYVTNHPGQGYNGYQYSSWSRGQAWALYGFALSYTHTGKQEYLDTAKRVAHYFIANVADTDWLPLCDFRAPEEPILYDSTAGACAACGLIEIAKSVDVLEQKLYLNAAMKLLKAMTEKFCDFNPETDPLLLMGTEAYGRKGGEHISIIYGDFFYVEAIQKLRKDIDFVW